MLLFFCFPILVLSLSGIRGINGWERSEVYGRANGLRSSTVYVEGDASIGTYQDGEGKTRSSLNIIQRTYPKEKKSRSRFQQAVTEY